MEPAAVSAEAAPILVTRNLTKSFRRLTALKNHSVQVKRGEIVGVIGPNGSGKSTFFNLVTGFLKPNAGTVSFDGQEIQHLTAPRIVRLGVARTFQGTRLFPQLSVRENMRAAAQLRHRLSFADAVLGLPRLAQVNRAVDQLTNEMLDLIGLQRQGRHPRRRSALWRSAPAGTGAGAGDAPAPVDAGRAGRRYERCGDARSAQAHRRYPPAL